jgi:hypothetical protein
MSSRPPLPAQAADPRLQPRLAESPAMKAPAITPQVAPLSAGPGAGVAGTGLGKKEPHRSLTVPFDEETWTQLEAAAATFGLPKSGTVRRCVRLAAWILDNLKDGYKLALLKKGESPRLVELI